MGSRIGIYEWLNDSLLSFLLYCTFSLDVVKWVTVVFSPPSLNSYGSQSSSFHLVPYLNNIILHKKESKNVEPCVDLSHIFKHCQQAGSIWGLCSVWGDLLYVLITLCWRFFSDYKTSFLSPWIFQRLVIFSLRLLVYCINVLRGMVYHKGYWPFPIPLHLRWYPLNRCFHTICHATYCTVILSYFLYNVLLPYFLKHIIMAARKIHVLYSGGT